MQGTITLKSRILQVRMIDISSTVGYGASYRALAPANCATVSVGYADGYLRSLTGRGKVVIGGESCPVIGRVSMDAIIVDTTKLARQPQAGDWAEIIGAAQTVDEVAEQAGTIGYEILTSLGKRYRRSYTGG
jgi:alanine racemase